LYAAAQQAGGDAGAQAAPGGGSAQPDDVVDAEFTEVKDGDKK
jgi:molecular chaperone DnaK